MHKKPGITFNHLPENVTLVIIKGKIPQKANSSYSEKLGIYSIQTDTLKIKTIEKNDISKFIFWDLKDHNGKFVSSGYYRAYLSGPEIPEKYFLDLSLDITVVFSSNY
jgi:hypothetical protein